MGKTAEARKNGGAGRTLNCPPGKCPIRYGANPGCRSRGPARTDAACGIPLESRHQPPPVTATARTAQVQLQFGIVADLGAVVRGKNAHVALGPGRLIFLTGPSGTGKSSALSAIRSHFEALRPNPRPCLDVHAATFDNCRALIDQIASQAALADAASLLTACGLGEAGLWLRPYSALSEGQRFRAALARTVSDALAAATPPVLLCDEFCSGLQRRAAKAIAHNLRKLITRRGLCAVVASAADDMTGDLDPDVLVKLSAGGSAVVESRIPLKSPIPSFRGGLVIEQGAKADYEEFAGMHYRGGDELGFVDRVFVLRQGPGGEALGIVVYAHAALELSLRNQATDGWFSKNPARVNRHLRTLRRLVIHPDVRGCGLGHYLVRKTMPMLGTRFVECLAAMGQFNPVFERAGMVRVGQYDRPAAAPGALRALSLMDVDPASPRFAEDIGRRPAVREVVAQAVADWYAATTGGGQRRVEGQSPEMLARLFRGLLGARPVYYIWRRGLKPKPSPTGCGQGEGSTARHADTVPSLNTGGRRGAIASPLDKGGHRGVGKRATVKKTKMMKQTRLSVSLNSPGKSDAGNEPAGNLM